MDAELAAQGATLAEGMSVLLWDEDEDQDGPALMVVDARAMFDVQKQRWVAEVDRDSFRYEANPDRPWRWREPKSGA